MSDEKKLTTNGGCKVADHQNFMPLRDPRTNLQRGFPHCLLTATPST